MKTAISIPDSIFQEAEKVAQRLKLTRSELYARALAVFLQEQQSAEITAKLDAVYAQTESALDERLARAQLSVLEKEQW